MISPHHVGRPDFQFLPSHDHQTDGVHRELVMHIITRPAFRALGNSGADGSLVRTPRSPAPLFTFPDDVHRRGVCGFHMVAPSTRAPNLAPLAPQTHAHGVPELTGLHVYQTI
jgi:hypothetical protein